MGSRRQARRRTPGLAARALLGGALALFVCGCSDGDAGDHGDGAADDGGHLVGRVARVIDGDTIEVDLGRRVEDVRYIGVDTPESVAPDQPVECFGRRASRFNHRLVSGRRVTLRFDAERRDRYGRLLAYVRVGPRLVNAELVRRGYARPLTIPPNVAHAERFERLAGRAGVAGRGLWSACGP